MDSTHSAGRRLTPRRHAAQNFQKIFVIGQAVTMPPVTRNATTRNTAEMIVETQ